MPIGGHFMTRIDMLKTKVFNEFFVKKEWWGDDLSILGQSEIAGKPLIMRKALAFEKVCKEMPIEVKDDELIVGIATMSSVGFGHTFPRYETDEEAAEFAKYSLTRKSIWGHHMPYYPEILEKGYFGIIADIDGKLGALPPQDLEKREFYEAARHTLYAAMELPRRYVELLTSMVDRENSAIRKAELVNIRNICRKVPAHPAETFQEALQSVWFVHLLLHSTLTYTPLGRIDQYLGPFYAADISRGGITPEYAKELVGSFLIKFNERTQFRREHMENHLTAGDWSQGGDPEESTTHFDMENDAEYTFGQSANHWLQSATVGGLGVDGKDATNDLSFFIIEMINKLELVSPMISARVHKDSPPEYLEFISSELCSGGAQPVLFNDDVIIKGLRERLKIPAADAWDYSSDGCWEVLIYGKTEYNYGHIEVMPCMEALINSGRSLVSNLKIGLDMGDVSMKLASYEDFYGAFMDQVRYRIDTALTNKIKYYDQVHRIAPEPYLSTFVKDCIEKGKDLTDKGARYRIYSLFVTGLSHCIDSLVAIKKLVYEQKSVTLEDAIKAIKANWEGYEDLRQLCLNRVPKYGNDSDEADAVLTTFLSDFCDHADEWNRRIDWIEVSAGVATFENYPRFGHNAWASFDGRLAHEAFSSNFSPAPGRDQEGPTAVLLSSAKFDLSRLNSGCPVDLVVSFDKEELQQRANVMLGFIKSFIELGCNIMTITRVDLETLMKAQKEPEKYVSLRVRLGGLTAYFVQLAKAQQDEYMRRTEHRM
jgi:choline trimethylamine-lyase